MKKLSAALVLLSILLLLSGCEGFPFAPDFAPQRAFTLHMTAEINGHSFAASLTCESYESMSLAFTAPPAFSYFSVRTEGTGYAMDVGGVPDETAAEELNGGAPLRLLFDTIKTAVFTNHGAFVRDKENGVYAAGLTVNGSPVSVVFDAEGYLRSLTAPGLTAAFSRTESHVDA